jgi:acetylornithine/succinyldiaminopimelate/putrescine aminotransferase
MPVPLQCLAEMKAASGKRISEGLQTKYLEKFLLTDPRLAEVIEVAYDYWKKLDAKTTYGMDEAACITEIFSGFQHLYPEETRQPYVPIASRGPWMVSMHGAVVHDSGGYGMLGYGHNRKEIKEAMAEEAVMANHMTPSLAHKDFIAALRGEIGRSRKDPPFESFICLNSGSEANEMALRLCDMHAGHVSGERKVHNLVMKGAFHGRTLSAALLTDTSRDTYLDRKAKLISKLLDGDGMNYTLTCESNNIQELRDWFKRCEQENCFIQSVYLEGVMGEGDPGVPLDPEFYKVARELTLQYDGALCIDSVQAGIRATGNLSICDYPGFENLPPPDFEIFSKALNGGQFPMSVVALSPRGAQWYRHGVYGNTMTGNPRACRVATAALKLLTPEIRGNIRDKGKYCVERYTALMKDFPEAIIRVNGTGMLYQVKLDPKIPVTAMDGVEMMLRRRGVNVIHGGTNALRFTPNFDITKEEIDMQVEHVRDVLLEKTGRKAPSSKL